MPYNGNTNQTTLIRARVGITPRITRSITQPITHSIIQPVTSLIVF
jgi:hypothetical protein